jgi:hypothetical protein
MRSYTQDELSAIWQQLKDGTEPDEALVFRASIRTDAEAEQTLTLSTVPRKFNDFDNDSIERYYTRKRAKEEVAWGMWEPYSPA